MNLIRSQRGQSTVEIVLLMAVTVTLALMVTRYLQQSKFAQKLAGNPWSMLSGMVECGTWKGCSTGQHPASTQRVLSWRTDDSI